MFGLVDTGLSYGTTATIAILLLLFFHLGKIFPPSFTSLLCSLTHPTRCPSSCCAAVSPHARSLLCTAGIADIRTGTSTVAQPLMSRRSYRFGAVLMVVLGRLALLPVMEGKAFAAAASDRGNHSPYFFRSVHPLL